MLNAIAVLVALAGLSAGEGPTDAQVLRALPRTACGVPYVFEEYRDNIVIVKNRLRQSTVSVPLFSGGTVNVEKVSWECTVYYDRMIQSDFPFPLRVGKPSVAVVYVDEMKRAK